ncbi:ribonuclease HII [Pelagovum pacificum]|uniref:Ribonuclease HII n=1 Tax=Pelagovum pacificum TaxID=2588711 RepID=A0A5C5GGV4_9RHOB|nr:ribonuclease HII [Pelagovum pacificum]QQA43057.1 ribonuclease HII [Pelagovum pacificum]TNY33800.1 ribonuclease HII [Pelagovum pacificum]
MTMIPDLSFETLALAGGSLRVAGVDEVGRGPLAGPVTAAAVILDPARIPAGLADSKTVPAGRRAALSLELHEVALVSIAHATVEEIDELNILRASHLAMVRALNALEADHALIDGNMLPRDLACNGEAIIKGDARCLSISAASIVAKVARDCIMVDLAQQHPGYGWETNAGYGTKSHISALQNLGVTPHHRRSFAPVRNILWQAETPNP